MSKKVAIVTGANKGLGFAIAKRLCESYNGTVYLTSRDENRGRNACEELRKLGLYPEYYMLDITDDESIKNFAKHLQDKHEEIEILVNNAGILFLNDAPEPKVFQAEHTVAINFTALVNFTEAILPFVKKGAKIVNVSSSAAHLCRIPSEELRKKISSEALTLEELKVLINHYITAVMHGEEINKGWGDSPYVVSKAAVNAYTFLLHRRLSRKGITVNCVHPGYVKSDMTKGGGLLTPEEAAVVPTNLALNPPGSGLYVWHNGTQVPWVGPDPRVYIDGRKI